MSYKEFFLETLQISSQIVTTQKGNNASWLQMPFKEFFLETLQISTQIVMTRIQNNVKRLQMSFIEFFLESKIITTRYKGALLGLVIQKCPQIVQIQWKPLNVMTNNVIIWLL